MSTGPNYFWLAYHVTQDAYLGNVLDAECVSFDIGATNIPAVIEPEGNRLIELVYCNAGSTQFSGEHIRRVIVFGNIDVTSMKGDYGYEDYTDEIVELPMGESIPICVVNSSPHNTNELLIWADWNQDADFSDANESVYASGPLGITTYVTNITVPDDAKLGLARLRLRLHDTSFGPNATPCGYSNTGEVEDYVVRVVEPKTGLADDPNIDNVSIYPNPASDELVMEVNGYENQVRYVMTDVMGRVLISGDFLGKEKLSLKDYAPDVYLIRFDIGGQQVWRKFVKVEGK